MKRPTNYRLFAILLGFLAAAAPMSAALAGGDDIMSDQAIVELVVGADINEINDEYGTTTLGSIEIDVSDPDDGLRLYLLQLPDYWDEDELEQWFDDDNDPRVVEAELNYKGETAEGQSESFYFNVAPSAYTEQYAWGLIGLEAAHQISTGDGIVVALLDTGAEADHESLVGHIVPGGFNFVDGNTDTSDVGNSEDDDGDGSVDEMVGHGTFMAGILARVAPDAGLLIIKVLNGDGISSSFRVAQGIYYAVENGADVISLSLAMPDEHDILEDAIQYAYDAGVVIVASAGNLDQQEPALDPAADSNTIGVASTDLDDHKSEFSNYGDHVSISAPGTDIVSSVPNNEYGQWEGTSMSVSFVSGAAALLKAINPSASPEAIKETLGDAAADLDPMNPEYAGLLGAGRLNFSVAPGEAITPYDVDAFRGFYNSGDLDSLLEADDNDLCHNPGIVLNPAEAPITLDFFGTLPNDSPASLDMTIESSANTGGLELTISFWNFNTNSWDVVGTDTQSLNADTVRTFAGVPADHVEAGTGEVRTRYEVRVVSFIFIFPGLDCVDHVFWTTTN